MNGRHWSDYSEQELGRMRARASVRASPEPQALGPARRHGPDRAVLVPARPRLNPLPGGVASRVQARAPVIAAQTPADWMREQPPPSRNGTAPAGSPPADAYPADWLREARPPPPRGGTRRREGS